MDPQGPAHIPPLLSFSFSSPASRAVIGGLDPSCVFGKCSVWHENLQARGNGPLGLGRASRVPGIPTTISPIQPGNGLFLHHSEL